MFCVCEHANVYAAANMFLNRPAMLVVMCYADLHASGFLIRVPFKIGTQATVVIYTFCSVRIKIFQYDKSSVHVYGFPGWSVFDCSSFVWPLGDPLSGLAP